MFEYFNELDKAVEFALEKATRNDRAHMFAALGNQEEYDKHHDALEHHSGAILHYRNLPDVKKWLEAASQLTPHRGYITAPLKLTNKTAPTITVDDLDHEHPEIKGLSDENKQKRVDQLNNAIKSLHANFHGNENLKRLQSHSNRYLGHMTALLEHHNLAKKGEVPHANFVGTLHAPEFTDRPARIKDSKYRSSFHYGDGVYTTQSLTKNGAAGWNPGFPELTSLTESHGHPSTGKAKELYPFHEVRINGKPVVPKTFESSPEEIHDTDHRVNLTKDHKVKTPDGRIDNAMGTYSGTKNADKHIANIERLGTFKKSNDSAGCTYFPDASIAHVIFAKNFIASMNPFASMTDEEFGDYVTESLTKSLTPSEQGVMIAESFSRLEKAKSRLTPREHSQGVEDVLSGKVTPLPLPDEGDEDLLGVKPVFKRTKKEGEKRDELQDIERLSGKIKRSPYAVPKEVFTDESYSKIDPEKYKAYVHGRMTEEDLRKQIASYRAVLRHNPEAQKAHQNYLDQHVQMARESLKSGLHGSGDEETPEMTPDATHAKAMQEAGAHLARTGDMEAYKKMAAEARKARDSSRRIKSVAEPELSPTEKEIKQIDPSYKVARPSAREKSEEASIGELTSIATGRAGAPSAEEKAARKASEKGAKEVAQRLAQKSKSQPDEDEDDTTEHEKSVEAMGTEGAAKEVVRSSKGEDAPSAKQGEIFQLKTPHQLISDHPGFASYLRMKDHLLSPHKDPAVRQYFENMISKEENNENPDPAKLSSIFHTLHRAHERARMTVKGQHKLLTDIASAPSSASAAEPETGPEAPGKGTAEVPETMMTPEQIGRLQEVRQAKATPAGAEAIKIPGAAKPAAAVPRTADPEYKKKLMAEYQAKADAAKQKK